MSKLFPKTFCEKVRFVWYDILATLHLLAVALVVLPSSAFAEAAASGAAQASNMSLGGGMSLISSELITAIFTGMAGVIGAIVTYQKTRKHAEEEKELAIAKALADHAKKTSVPQPLAIELKEQFVTRAEFKSFSDSNDRDHENIFGRLSVFDRSLGTIQGLLEGIRGDLSIIKGKLFKK